MSWLTPCQSLGMDEEMNETLELMQDQSEYWSSSYKFINQIGFRTPESLSEKQLDWAYDIIASLRVETNRRIANIVWKGIKPGNFNSIFNTNRPAGIQKEKFCNIN